MPAAALKAETDCFGEVFAHERLPDGRQRLVRHGAGPERVSQTGIGPIIAQRQKVRGRAADAPASAKIPFSPNIQPKWSRRSCSLDALLPVLYLRGVSMGDLQEALTAHPGPEAANPSSRVIVRLTRTSHKNMSAGDGATFPPAAMSTSGLTASICRRGWSPKPYAFS